MSPRGVRARLEALERDTRARGPVPTDVERIVLDVRRTTSGDSREEFQRFMLEVAPQANWTEFVYSGSLLPLALLLEAGGESAARGRRLFAIRHRMAPLDEYVTEAQRQAFDDVLLDVFVNHRGAAREFEEIGAAMRRAAGVPQ